MRFVAFTHHEDFGHEWDLYFLKWRDRSLFHFYLSNDDYGTSSGMGLEIYRSCGLRFGMGFGKITVSTSILGRSYD